ncbi:hypothetical protein F2Q69_00011009 [Brassica cretica]|uniref:Uncharacterized protein n=1 Tax=Brassica cretica TaxID=69181 RepID=A0A8S9QX26_BRACR|nr:hypothetical protein F2Q69_00011009 [Brassica cretica]
MNCARAGVENQNGCEIRTTSGTQNHHVLPPSSSHHHISLQKKNENKVMEKGKKEKKHGATGKTYSEKRTRRVVTFSNQELARLESTNRQQPGPNNATMGDYSNQGQLTAQLQQMQQQMLQMQQTIQAQQDAAQQAALEQATAGHIQNQNQRQPQSNQQVVPATGNSQPDELKGLGMMMQQLLQGMQIQVTRLRDPRGSSAILVSCYAISATPATPSRARILVVGLGLSRPMPLIAVHYGTHETPETVREGYYGAYLSFFHSCSLIFLIPEMILEILAELGLSLTQLLPNFLRHLVAFLVKARKEGLVFGLSEFCQFVLVKRNNQTPGTFLVSPHPGRHVIEDVP